MARFRTPRDQQVASAPSQLLSESQPARLGPSCVHARRRSRRATRHLCQAHTFLARTHDLTKTCQESSYIYSCASGFSSLICASQPQHGHSSTLSVGLARPLSRQTKLKHETYDRPACCQHSSDTVSPPSPPRVPGLLQQADCRRLLHAGKQGRLTAAWKELLSYGVAPADRDTVERLRAKWLPAPLFPIEMHGSYSTTATASEAIQQAASRLTTGSAMDALSWSHESWSRAFQLPCGKALLQELLVLYCTGELGHEGEDLMNASLLIPLHKDATGTAIRPIAVPTVHRKIFAKIQAECRHAHAPWCWIC